MLRYDYRCLTCDEVMEALRDVDKRNDCPDCDCGGKTKKIISTYKVHGDLEPYFDETLDTHIQSKKHRQVVMKEQGVSENFGQGWFTSARKHRH